LEEKYALELDFSNLIFSPPGSMIYSSSVMEKLKNESLVIYLVASAEDIKERLGEKLYKDGIIGLETKGLENVVKERLPLYEKYADCSIKTSGLSPERVLVEVLNMI
jgi:shikimate kinase